MVNSFKTKIELPTVKAQSKVKVNNTDVNLEGIKKAYIPGFLYKPPFGYPRKDNPVLYRRLAETPYVFSVVKTLCDEASSLEWDICVKEGIENPEQYDEKIKEVKAFLQNPNGNEESWEHIQRAFMRDLLELDSGVIVKVFDKQGKLKELYARDAISFLKNADIYGCISNRADFIMPMQLNPADEHTEELSGDTIQNYYNNYVLHSAAYFQYGWTAGSFPVPFGKREIVYMMANPRTDSIYGRSPLDILQNTIMTLQYGNDYHLDFYVNGNVPEGIISIPGAQEEELQALSSQLHDKTHVLDALDNERRIGSRIPLTSYTDPKFIPFQLSPKEMEVIQQQQWFIKMVWMCYGVTPDEMGYTETSNRAVGDSQAKVFKRKALRPICNVIEYHVNTQILPEFFVNEMEGENKQFGDYEQKSFDMAWELAIKECPIEFKYKDYDVEEDIKKHTVYQMEINMGVRTAEMVAEELGINVEELKVQKEEAHQKQMEMFKQQSNMQGNNDNKDEKENPFEKKKPFEKEEKGLIMPSKQSEGAKESARQKRKADKESEGEEDEEEETSKTEKQKVEEKSDLDAPEQKLSDDIINYIDEVGKQIEKLANGN